MNAQTMYAAAAAVYAVGACVYANTRKRRWGIQPDIQRRATDGEFVQHYRKKRSHPERFFSYMRMLPEHFDLLLSKLMPFMKQQQQFGRRRITNEERLAVTLRYLATGASMAHLSHTWLIGESTLRVIINETLDAIWNSLQPVYMMTPNADSWREKAVDFSKLWNLPFCVGALDGKHVVMDAPAKSGSIYYNYKVI